MNVTSPTHNRIYESTNFNQLLQLRGESVNCLITSLYSLVEHCEYGALTIEIIRDRIVVGILNSLSLSEQIQLYADLNLEKAITKARQSETLKHQRSVVKGKDSSTQP